MSDQMEEDPPTTNRRRPNILITGSPGVGKTSAAASIAKTLGGDVLHINVGKFAQEHDCYEGWDAELDTNILDEDRLLDLLEVTFQEAAASGKGIVADFHVCEIFPERWFDLVLVLRASTETLFDRLTDRRYSEKKRSENLEAEIMQVVLEEARKSYAQEIVHELQSNTLEDLQANVQRACQWYDQWVLDHGMGA